MGSPPVNAQPSQHSDEKPRAKHSTDPNPNFGPIGEIRSTTTAVITHRDVGCRRCGERAVASAVDLRAVLPIVAAPAAVGAPMLGSGAAAAGDGSQDGA